MTDFSYDSLGFKDILVTLDSGVLLVLINRPKQKNMFEADLANDIIRVFEVADKDDRVRAVVLSADPTAPAYCSGANITGGWDNLLTPEEKKEGLHSHRDGGGKVAMAIYHCRKLTIAAVNGHAAGVGCTALQLPFDIRFAWKDAKIIFPFVRRGIVPEATSSYLLPRLIGQSRATAVLLTGDILSPTSRHLDGLYHTVLPTRAEVLPAALAFAKELAQNTSQVSVAYAKGLIQHPGADQEENHLHDSYAMAAFSKARDAREGTKAFFERRAPKFEDTLSDNLPSYYPWWRPVDIRHRASKL
ncbi:ClpP/crotonase-like domain-containing protein [Schizophyllum commune]